LPAAASRARIRFMEGTCRLYYERPELLEAEATVVAVEGDGSAPVLELDRTIFYPEGGGQPCDLGSVDGQALASVTEKEGRVLHAMAGSCPVRAGDSVRLRVDGARRLDYSQAHTGQHLLSATALRLVGAPTVSAHFGKERCAIDLDVPSISEEEMAAIEDAVERAIAEDHPIRAHLCPPEDIASFALRKRPPAGEEVLRIVEIDGIDFTPCCGTHLSSTGKLRLVRVIGTEKYTGMTRLYFLAGGRAAADYRSVSRIAQDAARSLGISVGELGAAVSREAERRKNLEFANAGLIRERAAMEARAAASELGIPAAGDAGHPAGSPPLVSRRYPDRDASSLMETAKAFASAGMTALLASVPELTVQALSPTADQGLGELLKPLLATAGGRGGGGAASFRAVLPDAASLDLFMAAAEAAMDSKTKR
jgi:alanyl-tRNA synthetase